MTSDAIAAYLNDHLAGSVTAVDLLHELEKIHRGTELAQTVAALRAEIEADQKELKALMAALGIAESRPRKTSAWTTARLVELKLHLDDDAAGALRLLETAEAVALGIDGKLALWRALGTAAEITTRLSGVDYQRLARRAEEQRQQVEEIRLHAAKAALI